MISKSNKLNRGMTLIELVMTLSILAILSVTLMNMFININNIQVKSTVKENIQSEMRTLMEKIVQDIRNSSIDFRGYYVMNGPHISLGEVDKDDSNLSYINIPTSFPTGGDILNPAPYFINDDTHIKREDILLLLDSTGGHRVKYMAIDNSLKISKQTYANTGICNDLPELATPYNGSHVWNPITNPNSFCWVLDNDYDNNVPANDGYLTLSTPSLAITDLQFFFNVAKSPFKVYEENDIQLQPMLTIKMTGVSASSDIIIGTTPTITLQTTITARNYEETSWLTY